MRPGIGAGGRAFSRDEGEARGNVSDGACARDVGCCTILGKKTDSSAKDEGTLVTTEPDPREAANVVCG